LTLNDLLKMSGLDIDKKTKLVRHQDSGFDTDRLYREGRLEHYQSCQSKNVFGDCDYIVTFLGHDRTQAKFIGIFQVIAVSQPRQLPDQIYTDFWEAGWYFYELRRTDFLSDLIERLVIEWGGATRSWYQWLNDKKPKEVIEILPKGCYDSFPGFEDFVLDYNSLKKIVENPDANRMWHIMLSSVAGVYLIVDTEDGKQYVGSAYGNEGILGRFKEYVRNGYGGNKLLMALPIDRYSKFQFTILRTLSKTLTNAEVIDYENLYKDKLGSRAFGLNAN